MPDHRHRRLLRAHRTRPGRRRAAQQLDEVPTTDVDSHVTLRLRVMPMQCRGAYHAFAKDERCFCAAKGWSCRCLRWVKPGITRAEHKTRSYAGVASGKLLPARCQT